MTRWALFAALALGACANGDGHGFASVDGTLRVATPKDNFKTAAGEPAVLERVTLTVSSVGLVELREVNGQRVAKTAALPVGSSFDPLLREYTLPFGPYEVDRGDYNTLSVQVSRVELEGAVGTDRAFTVTLVPDSPLVFESGASLPVDGETAPNVHLQLVLQLPRNVFEGMDPLAKDAANVLSARLAAATGVVNATWTRTGD